MSIDLSNLSQRLTNKEEVFEIVDTLVRNMLFPRPPENLSFILGSDIIQYYAKQNVNDIFKYATSSIEKVFFSSILIYGLSEGIFFLQFTPSLNSVTEQIESTRAYYSSVMRLWEEFQRQTGETSIDAFLVKFVFQLDAPEDLKIQMIRSLKMKIFDSYNTYFLSIKSILNEILFKDNSIETDIFIWTISDPNFRLAVECDELDYYPDKSSFSDDGARDRLLQSKGIQVLRFSGFEIMSNPAKKAIELIAYLEKCRDKENRLHPKPFLLDD